MTHTLLKPPFPRLRAQSVLPCEIGIVRHLIIFDIRGLHVLLSRHADDNDQPVLVVARVTAGPFVDVSGSSIALDREPVFVSG